MQQHKIKVIAVDDDEFNLEILSKNLIGSGYDVNCFNDGDIACDFMETNPEKVDVVLLDKMMPKMNGMDVLKLMKKHPVLKKVPVIIQTGDAGAKEAREGLALGAYYYLTKPFDPEMMLSLVNAAVRDLVIQNEARKNSKADAALAGFLFQGTFRIKSIEDAKTMATLLAANTNDKERYVVAFTEVLVNAVEHGNLNVGYEMKKKLLSQGRWLEEVNRRLTLPENQDKYVTIEYRLSDNEVIAKISDQGNGFNHKEYMEFDAWRLTDPNGRGIATANNIGLKMEFLEPGNQVICMAPRKVK